MRFEFPLEFRKRLPRGDIGRLADSIYCGSSRRKWTTANSGEPIGHVAASAATYIQMKTAAGDEMKCQRRAPVSQTDIEAPHSSYIYGIDDKNKLNMSKSSLVIYPSDSNFISIRKTFTKIRLLHESDVWTANMLVVVTSWTRCTAF